MQLKCVVVTQRLAENEMVVPRDDEERAEPNAMLADISVTSGLAFSHKTATSWGGSVPPIPTRQLHFAKQTTIEKIRSRCANFKSPRSRVSRPTFVFVLVFLVF